MFILNDQAKGDDGEEETLSGTKSEPSSKLL